MFTERSALDERKAFFHHQRFVLVTVFPNIEDRLLYIII